MKAKALTVHWHLENQPIYSAHFQPSANGANRRLATAGGDNNVRIWRLEYQDQANPTAVTSLTYLATLAKHTQAVNVVRFDSKGLTLASAGDDGVIFLWSLSDSAIPKALGEDTEDDKETWKLRNMCRSSISEIYDLAWSPDSQYLIAGSMDNVARVYNASTGQCIRELAEHSHYVQGVAWDPFNEYIATQSSDRSVHIYNLKTKDGQFSLGTHHKIARVDLPARKLPTKQAGEPPASPKADNSRVSVSPDYSAPETPSSSSSSTMNPPPPTVKPSYSRKSSPPVAFLPGLRKPSLAISCSPIYYTLRGNSKKISTSHISIDTSVDDVSTPGPALFEEATEETVTAPVFALKYRMVYAVATQDSIIVYDTEQKQPLCIVSNLHYSTFTDLTWSPDGNNLLMTSTDGFCSVIIFDKGELGTPYTEPIRPPVIVSQSPTKTVGNTTVESFGTNTPVLPATLPVFVKPSTSTNVNSSTSNSVPVASSPVLAPTSALTTEPLVPLISSMPPIATHGTPPQTPQQSVAQLSTRAPKRANEEASARSDRSSTAASSTSSKKRRIAPTLVEKKD
ncbi:hypothetical protein D0Z00_002103 [Geotrichum galactomycetum]|uniref:Uncharacterized protein n=1 Tax=Geotrichum galactomycetum TaxID=27317 RepID=A0ACB6V515_9ASCO|nr:hypothetical protein D0Z00_002103 [Geotrichum candidum]